MREQMARESLESVHNVETEVEAECAKLCRRIGDDVTKSACYVHTYVLQHNLTPNVQLQYRTYVRL